jgi:uncharacterized protein YndB with AHSA1/START domain
MQASGYTTTFLVDETPTEVFHAINHVPGWWPGQVSGDTDRLGAEFTYEVPGAHRSKQQITAFSPGKQIVWRVVEAELSFASNKTEWVGTEIVFEIAAKGGKTEVRFTHRGLVPAFDCYNGCSNAWNLLVNGNLRRLIATGETQPSPW